MTVSKKKQKKAVIILGPPGSGKGTQSELLSRKLDLYHFETSEIIERNLLNSKKEDFVKIGGKKYFLWQEKKLRDSGKWMSPPLISFWVKNKFRVLAKEGKGIVISGSPKTLHEAKEIVPLLKKIYGILNIIVIVLEQKPEVSIWRNSRRRVCTLERHSILYTKEAAGLKSCPLDGSNLVLREDSKPRVIRMKLKEYQERTLPILQHLEGQGFRIIKINGDQIVRQVFKEVEATVLRRV